MRKQWLENGYVICRNAIDVSGAQKAMCELYPRETPHPVQDFGNGGEGEFFCKHEHLNDISVHPILLRCARECLGTDDIILTQSVAWAKYGQPVSNNQSNSDQRVHMDFGNHYWGVPPEIPDMIAAIVYYSDTEETGGGTAVVPKQGPDDPIYQRPFSHMPGLSGHPFINDRMSAEAMMAASSPESASIREQCYAREKHPTFKPGDVLFYSMTTWHRGTPVKTDQVRYVHNLAWRKKNAEGIQDWNPALTRSLYYGPMERFLSKLEPSQLESLGFPSRDSPKWQDEAFCDQIRSRYAWAGFDVGAYMKQTQAPPPVPQYWVFSPYTLTGKDAHALRERLFEAFKARGACITPRTSNWYYEIEYCEGFEYVKADCRFFQRLGHQPVIVDIQHIYGDRFVWARLLQRVKNALGISKTPVKSLTMPSQVNVAKTEPWLTKALQSGEPLSTDLFPLIGEDTKPEYLVSYLHLDNPNIAYAAALRLKQLGQLPDDCTAIYQWATKIPENFLERRTSDICRDLLHLNSKL